MRTSTFKEIVAFLLLCSTSPGCFAQGRPDTTMMSCKAAVSLVSARGAVVLGSGPMIYDRYVTSNGFCNSDEITRPAFVPTTDNQQCFIGYYCFPKVYDSRHH